MNQNNLTEEEILRYIDQGLIESVPAEKVVEIFDYAYGVGLEHGEHTAIPEE